MQVSSTRPDREAIWSKSRGPHIQLEFNRMMFIESFASYMAVTKASVPKIIIIPFDETLPFEMRNI